jgi:hypothetical protein
MEPEPALPEPNLPAIVAQITEAHALYSQLTGQRLSLGFDRERAWYELLRAGYTLEDLRRVVGYLQQEIRAGRRNVGALKLSNLLQLDRFEEDLNISRIRLRPPAVLSSPQSPPPTKLSAEQQNQGRQKALELLAKLRAEQGL